MKKQSRLAKKLAAHFATLKAKRKLQNVTQKFRPTKRERDSFVFIDSKGKRRPVNTRASGFLFYVDKKGKSHRVTQGKGDIASHRYRDFDLTQSRFTKAREKWLRAWNFVTFGKPTVISAKNSLSPESIGRRLNPVLTKYVSRYGSNNLMVAELAITVDGKTHRTSFLLTGAQLRGWNQGKRGFLKQLTWKAISTELSLNDLVAKTSADFIRHLKQNKGKAKGKWTDKHGQLWGKSKYKTVKVEKVEVRIKVSTKNRLK